MKQDLFELRNEYAGQPLRKKDLPEDPYPLFRQWLDEALGAGCREPNAMTLSTSTPGGGITSRIVLLKSMDEAGIAFFTNYNSAKAVALEENSSVAALFFWPELWRQVRIEGKAEKLDPGASDRYFASRPRGSQLAAWASPQSEKMDDREALEKAYREQEKAFEKQAQIPRPAFWGGYRILPSRVEFWQGRENRLHDRIRYSKKSSGWQKERLGP